MQLDQSFVSLDLGGGSTQITFAPKSNHVEGLEGRKHFMHEVNVLQNMIKVRNEIRHVRSKRPVLRYINDITTRVCLNSERRLLFYL